VTGSPRGVLIVLSAPSGAGKTTLVRELLRRAPELEFSVSYTTRPQRPGERHGVDYFFVVEERFRAMVAADEFLEHARVFDHWYGTSRAYVEALLDRGRNVLLEIDWQGAEQVRRASADAVSVFILPPSLPELERRLRDRRSDSVAVVERRLRDAVGDMSHWREFDYVLINEDLGTAVAELMAIIRGQGEAFRTNLPAVAARVGGIVPAEIGLAGG
jgi:guanylate kinase